MSTEPLRVGDRVRVIGGSAYGRDVEGIIEMALHTKGLKSMYRIILPSGHLTGWLWAEGLEKVSDAQGD